MTSINTDASAVAQFSRGSDPAQAAANQRSSAQEALRQRLAAEVERAAEAAEARPSPQDLQDAAAELSEYLALTSRALSIRVDQDLALPVVTVLDADTDEVVRQIPSEEVLAIARFIRTQQASTADQAALAGVILNEEG